MTSSFIDVTLLSVISSYQMLLPLFTQLDFPQEGAEEASESPEVAMW